MRKFYFLVFGILFLNVVNAQVIEFTDLNFKTKVLSSSAANAIARDITGSFMQIDVNNDGEIQESEALLVRELLVNNAEINDMTGIQYFKNLWLLSCANNQIQSLDLSGIPNLNHLMCQNNNLTTLDLSGTKVKYFTIDNNPLLSLNLKNGVQNGFPPGPPGSIPTSANSLTSFSGLTSLLHICVDDFEVTQIKNKSNNYGYNCEINTYCTFVPGGVYYVMNTNARINSGNECSSEDPLLQNMKYSISNSSTSTQYATNGNALIPMLSGTNTITPILENPGYFTVSPTSASVAFPSETSPFEQNFCITPNGNHSDIEVVILPLEAARPGFDAKYKILYKNKGNVALSETLYFSYPEDRIDFVSSSVSPDLITDGTLAYLFNNLQPLETRSITVTLNINSPMEVPAVNGGDILALNIHAPLVTDVAQGDNFFSLSQTVVNSYDPNDKTCLQGAVIAPEMVGKYVNYMIRFENAGTANAENIVVKDVIDITKFDISSLVPLDGSHNFSTRISNVNNAEFIFENIQLPFDDANNDGYVAFKIKTKSTLVAGDTFSNTANIYFDYNFPIITDPAITTVQGLGVDDVSFSNNFMMYPNPVKDIFSVSSTNNSEISSISIYSILGQLILTVPGRNLQSDIDVSHLESGTYLIKVTTLHGRAITKFIKK